MTDAELWKQRYRLLAIDALFLAGAGVLGGFVIGLCTARAWWGV